jgi:hypothetical protein
MGLPPDTRTSSAQGPLVREQEMLRFAARWNTPFLLSRMPADKVFPNLPSLLGGVMRCYLMVFEAECRIIRLFIPSKCKHRLRVTTKRSVSQP